MPEPIAAIAEFAIYSGFRKENILAVRIEVVRFHDLTATTEVELLAKCGKRELLALGPAATEVVKRAIGGRHEGYVFLNPQTGTRYTSIHKACNRAVRKLGLTIGGGSKLRFHDLRHVSALASIEGASASILCDSYWVIETELPPTAIRALTASKCVASSR